MPVSNVSTVWMSDGETYGYLCGDGCLWRYHANGLRTGARIQLKTTQASPGASNPVIAAVGPADPQGTPVRHLFYRQPNTNNLWYCPDSFDDSSQTQLLTAAMLMVGDQPIQMAATFGGVALGTGMILVGVTPDRTVPTVTIVSIPWAALQTSTWMVGVVVTFEPLVLPPDDVAVFDPKDADVACDVVTDPSTGDPILLVVTRRKDKHSQYLDCWQAEVDADLAVGNLTGQVANMSSSRIQYPKISVRPDNLAVVYYFDSSGGPVWSSASASSLVPGQQDAAAWTAGDVVCQPEMAVVDLMAKGKSTLVNYGPNAFELVYACGEASISPSANNSDLTDSTIPLTLGVVFYNGNGTMSELYNSVEWGCLARTGLPVVPGNSILMGIIEGPPPIPNENLNIPDSLDPLRYNGQPGYAFTSFGLMNTTTSAMKLTWSAGLVLKASFKLGGGQVLEKVTGANAWVKAQVSLSATYKGAYEDVETTQLVSTVTVGSEIQGGAGGVPYSVQPAGSLVIMNADWTGYSFGFVNSDGSVPVEYPTLHAIHPTNIEITSQPYLMNPTSGPTPGVLRDYVLSTDEESALQSGSTIALEGGTSYLTGSWSYNSKATPVLTTTSSASWTNGLSLGLDVTLSSSARASLFLILTAEVESSVGVVLTFETTWMSQQSQGVQIGGDISLRGNVAAPNSYISYTYYYYLLAESATWTSDLLTGMVTADFPADPQQRARQQALMATINTGSQPWKLCYSVNPASLVFNPPVFALLAEDSDLADRYGGLLSDAGVRTAVQLEQLLAVAGGTGPVSESLPEGVHSDKGTALATMLRTSAADRRGLQECLSKNAPR